MIVEKDDPWHGVGFQPPFEEVYEEAMEFSSGQIGMLRSRLSWPTTGGPRPATWIVDAEPGSTSFAHHHERSCAGLPR